MILIGPTPLAGIGQVMIKYAEMFNSEYYVLGQDTIPQNEDAFIFALPIDPWFQAIPIIKKVSKKVICMTICETETVHEDYGKLFDMFDKIAVASEFCKKIFSRQFPNTEFYVVRCYTPPKNILKLNNVFNLPSGKYIFYHIGNIMDQRKNIKQLIETYYRCDFGDKALLVLKATCNKPVEWKLPNVVVLNGLLPDNILDQLHLDCDCYVSFSNSEGVGMGAVEAAMQDKPVIITEYGGAIEYIKTPYSIPCDLQEIPCDDFLFKKGMLWGKPDKNKLMEFMKDAFEKKLNFMDHTHTRRLISKESILKDFCVDVICEKNNQSG